MRFHKTEEGQEAFKARSPLLSARQRSAFILFDGNKSSGQVLAATVGLGITRDDIDHLVQQGFLLNTAGPLAGVLAAPALSLPFSAQAKQDRYSAAMPMATQLTASLGLMGLRLNLAVEAATGYDDLLTLLPKIEAAVGVARCEDLAQVLQA